MHHQTAALALVIATACAPAFAEAEGDLLRGKAYSQAMCSSCHSIAPQGASTSPAAKPFRNVDLGQQTAEDFAHWLNTAHPPIPSVLIKPAQAADIATFIGALKSGKAD